MPIDDPDAVLFRNLYPGLRRFAAVVAGDDIAPDDLVQAVIARLLRRQRLVDLNEPESYLRRAITNEASNGRRRWRRTQAALARAEYPLVEIPDYPSELSELLMLNPLERGSVYLHDIEGYPFEYVAQILGSSPEAARKAASRGRKRLRTAHEPQEGSERGRMP